MGKKAFKLARTDVAEPCPKCKNTQSFVAHSSQFAEDCCEIWIVCRCGFDPTEEKTAHRMEDVWGSLDPENISAAIECSWNDVVRAAVGKPALYVMKPSEEATFAKIHKAHAIDSGKLADETSATHTYYDPSTGERREY